MHSSREHFHTYLQSLDAERGGLPEQFRERLRRVLRHYGVDALDRTPELEAAVFRIFLAQQRTTPEVALVSALLGSWSRATPPTGELAGRARELLERLGRVPSRAIRRSATWPAASASAGSTSRRWMRSGPTSCWASVTSSRRWPLSPPASTDRHAHRGAGRHPRADRPLPRRAARAAAIPTREPMLEVLARRHYREYELHDLTSFDADVAPGRGRELHPRRPPDPAGLLARHGGRAGRRLASSSPRSASTSPLAPPMRRRSSTSTSHWPDAPADADEASRRSLSRWWPRSRWLTTYDASASPSAPAATGRSATSSSAPSRHRAERTWSRTT